MKKLLSNIAVLFAQKGHSVFSRKCSTTTLPFSSESVKVVPCVGDWTVKSFGFSAFAVKRSAKSAGMMETRGLKFMGVLATAGMFVVSR
jgi:hypothetical protein